MLTVSSIPGDQLPQPGFFGWDKLAHVAEYAVLAALLWRYGCARWPGAQRRRSMILTFAAAVLFAVIDELHQIPIPCRTCSGYDLAADAAGIAVGLGWAAKRSVAAKSSATLD